MNNTCHECGETYERLGQHWARGSCNFPELTEKHKEIITGVLMGDGYVTRRGRERPRFEIDNTNEDYLYYLNSIFGRLSNGIRRVKTAEEAASDGSQLKRVSDDSEFRPQYRLSLVCHPEMKQFANWYDNGEKEYPKNLSLSFIALKHWYACDGNLSTYQLSFACDNEADNKEAVSDAIEELTGGNTEWYDYEDSSSIVLSADASKTAFNKMGRPPSGMHYKWPDDTIISGEKGEYNMDAGNPHPLDSDEINYDPCNAVLKYTFERYGERRYCGALAVSNFTKHDVNTDYNEDAYCRHHQQRAELMKQHEENFTTGAYTKSHEHKFQYLAPHKQLLANDLYKSLIEESSFEYESESSELEIDVSETEFAPDADILVMDHPIPSEKRVRGKALWHAALDFVTMESIREEQFRVSAEDTGPDGSPLAIGETTTTVTVTEEGREIEDRDEHHLNIALSRIQKDYEQHLKFGGVEYDVEGDTEEMTGRDWVAVIEPDEPSPQPEAKTGDTSELTEIETPTDDG